MKRFFALLCLIPALAHGASVKLPNAAVTDEVLIRMDGTSGELAQTTGITVSDTNALAGVATIDTGPGATEVHLMDQNVQTSDTVQFANVGINEASPEEELEVNGDIMITNANWYRGESTGGTNVGLIGIDAGDDTVINAFTANDIEFQVGSTLQGLVRANYSLWGGQTSHSENDPSMVVSRQVSDTTGASTNVHGIVVVQDVSKTGGAVGLNDYDSKTTTSGTANFDHMAGFQARQDHTSTGTLQDMMGLQVLLTNNGGNNTRRHGVRIREAAEDTGTVTNNFGISIETLAKGSTSNRYITIGRGTDDSVDRDIIYIENATAGNPAFRYDTDEDNFTFSEATRFIGTDAAIYIQERATAASDQATFGQIWVKNTTPNELWFTDDAGTDVQLGVGGLPVTDTTSIAEGSADATKEVRFEVDGNTTGIVGVLATTFTTAKTITFPDITGTIMLNLSEDTTPALGGNLAVGSNEIQSTGNIVLQLGDAAGANKLAIQDSASVEVGSWNSDGDITMQDLTVNGNMTAGGLLFAEKADAGAPGAGNAEVWVDNTAQQLFMFTDDTDTDHVVPAIAAPVQGDVIYHNGTEFVRLAPGAAGEFLQTQGAAANPIWATASGSGDITDVGPAYATGAAFTDGVDTGAGTTMLIWEGDTVDAFELNIIAPADPTADINITFPGTGGTLVGTGDTGTVTTTMVADDSLDFGDFVDAMNPEAGTYITGADTLGGNPAFAVDTVGFGTTGLIFEGASADDFELLLTAGDPTADVTISLPNVTGTLITDNDTGTVTGTMIVNGTIAEVDIAAAAVSAAALDEAGVEAGLEAVMDLEDMQGAVTDAQVPDSITIDHSAAGSIRLQQSANPNPTVEGDIHWETDVDHIVVGDGAGEKHFIPSAGFSGDMTVDTAGSVTIAANAIGASEITDGTVANADISSTAAIARSKIADGVRTEFVPVGWFNDGATPPAVIETFEDTRKVEIRKFDDAAAEDVEFYWQLPSEATDAVAGGDWQLKYRVIFIITEATGPSTEGVSFDIQGVAIADNEDIGAATLGTIAESDKASFTAVQNDLMYSDFAEITLTGAVAGEGVFFKLSRDVADAVDTYAQDIGVVGLEFKYTYSAATY